MTTTLRLEIDLGMGDNVLITEDTVRNAALGLLVEADVEADAETVTLFGPAAGCPVVAFIADREDLIKIVKAYNPWEQAEDFVDEYATAVTT